MPDAMAVETELFAELKARLPHSVVKQNEPLARRTTLRVGGPAELYCEPAGEADLAAAVAWCAERALPFLMLGRGSNLLIRDGGVRGLVLHLAAPVFSSVEARGDTLRCGAGAKLKMVSGRARELSLGGLEFLEGIPGSVGGALRMNAGAMGAATGDVITRVRYMDFEGRVAEIDAPEIPFGYRSSPFFRTHLALAADFRGKPAPRETILQTTRALNAKRWESQPKEPSAGCMFKNPATPAGRLIDELGLKGTRVGGASVSTVHGNFIVNEGDATARDVLDLISLIQARARAARGIELQTEVEIIGEDL
ncbi:MAG TPA: UDP-N-acetylmuramate dehydrogenase [Verrucomicrobiae bacterium]|jgi:UDP-N-acetylenolpyruvoylglucosamine reductase|nr:UDP-N-acetylmuramate dehydrogenase [Verrucomicrobiae bacterium]